MGICSTGHGAALALVSSIYGIRAMTLDRFTAKKHSIMFSRRELADITQKRTPIDSHIFDSLSFAFGKFPPSFVFEDIFIPFFSALVKGLPLMPENIDLVVGSQSHFAINRGRLGNRLNRYLPNAAIYIDMEHHHVHQCQAFLASPFKEAAVLTVDQSGESLRRLGWKKIALTLSEASGNSIRVIHEHTYPESSPGLIYDIVSQHIGFRSGQEGKTMGLAPYGTDRIYRDLVKDLKLFDDGSFWFLSGREFEERLCGYSKIRNPRDEIKPVHADIAYAGQAILEDVMTNAVDALEHLVPDSLENLCISGGVALNSVVNEKIIRNSRFKKMYITPNSNDDGHALGCALYAMHVLCKKPRSCGLVHDYLGPVYSDAEIKENLIRFDLKVERLENRSQTVAQMLVDGLIVGWFQGASEFGPRALGNRSILADSRPAGIKQHLNRRVKHREPFRPFAPVVLEEKASEWFDMTVPSRFMLRVVPVLPEKRKHLAAVTHVDGTARVQTITERDNPRVYHLIESFEKITSIPVILNTSFNVAGSPIVETPRDAIECYLSTGIDVLVLGDFIVKKPRLYCNNLLSQADSTKRN